MAETPTNHEQNIVAVIEESIERLQKMQAEDETIPEELVYFGDLKVRTNWWQELCLELEDLDLNGLLNNQAEGDEDKLSTRFADFFKKFSTKEFALRRKTKEDINEANKLITDVIRHLRSLLPQSAN